MVNLRVLAKDRRIQVASLIVISGFVFLVSLGFLASYLVFGEVNLDEQPSEGPRGMFILMIFSVGVISGLSAFYYYFPEVRRKPDLDQTPGKSAPAIEIIKYVSTEEETLVIDAIEDLGERTYQFEISRYSGLSRMKVHRILKRLEERGIIHRDQEGRGSRVFLSKWLLD